MPSEKALTPSQTVGPFFQLGLESLTRADLTHEASGPSITIRGAIFDGKGVPVPDALIETWQADERGIYPTTDGAGQFKGFGRVATGDVGQFELRTIRPGRVPGPDGTTQSPHLVVAIFMRGLLKPLFTRIYFDGDAANRSDPILSLVDAQRQRTLLAVPQSASGDVYMWNIHLQGRDETVFFDI